MLSASSQVLYSFIYMIVFSFYKQFLYNSGELYTTVLSIYMAGGEKELLPSADEVLLCTQETTAEQVNYRLQHVFVPYYFPPI